MTRLPATGLLLSLWIAAGCRAGERPPPAADASASEPTAPYRGECGARVRRIAALACRGQAGDAHATCVRTQLDAHGRFYGAVGCGAVDEALATDASGDPRLAGGFGDEAAARAAFADCALSWATIVTGELCSGEWSMDVPHGIVPVETQAQCEETWAEYLRPMVMRGNACAKAPGLRGPYVPDTDEHRACLRRARIGYGRCVPVPARGSVCSFRDPLERVICEHVEIFSFDRHGLRGMASRIEARGVQRAGPAARMLWCRRDLVADVVACDSTEPFSPGACAEQAERAAESCLRMGSIMGEVRCKRDGERIRARDGTWVNCYDYYRFRSGVTPGQPGWQPECEEVSRQAEQACLGEAP